MLHRRAADVRSQRPLVFADGATDPVGEAIEADRVMGQACRLLGLMGASAHVGPGERTSLRDKGLCEREIDQVDVVARRHARTEDARDWLIGPERAVLVHHLDASGVVPTDIHVRRLRAGALCLMAELFERTGDRYAVVASHVGDIASEILREPDPIRSGVSEPIRPERATEAAVQPDVTEEEHTLKPANDVRPSASFIALVKALARSKTSLKAQAWDDKTARQHLSMARCADLDEDEIGLSAETINRHRTQLSTILAHMAENGHSIGAVSEKSVAKDTKSPEENRRPFSVEDGRKLITGAPWSKVDGL